MIHASSFPERLHTTEGATTAASQCITITTVVFAFPFLSFYLQRLLKLVPPTCNVHFRSKALLWMSEVVEAQHALPPIAESRATNSFYSASHNDLMAMLFLVHFLHRYTQHPLGMLLVEQI